MVVRRLSLDRGGPGWHSSPCSVPSCSPTVGPASGPRNPSPRFLVNPAKGIGLFLIACVLASALAGRGPFHGLRLPFVFVPFYLVDLVVSVASTSGGWKGGLGPRDRGRGRRGGGGGGDWLAVHPTDPAGHRESSSAWQGGPDAGRVRRVVRPVWCLQLGNCVAHDGPGLGDRDSADRLCLARRLGREARPGSPRGVTARPSAIGPLRRVDDVGVAGWLDPRDRGAAGRGGGRGGVWLAVQPMDHAGVRQTS